MKIYILIFLVLLATIIVILKLITAPHPVTSPEITHDINGYDTGQPEYQNRDEIYYRHSTNGEIDDRKLMAFAKAFVEVQSYMNTAGSKADYNVTTKIVQDHGLSVKDYTMIASRMNVDSDFQNRVQEMINEAYLQNLP